MPKRSVVQGLPQRMAASAVALLCACSGGSGARPAAQGEQPASAASTQPATEVADTASAAATDSAHVTVGVDVLVADGPGILAGKRVGLITNHTGRTSSGESTIDVLDHMKGVKLVALFGPEHGIRGTADPGANVASGRDAKTGLPVYSLYGKNDRPTPEMLKNVDVLVYDIQDLGVRFYTYEWTMALSMKSAKEKGIPFVVLDRPDPIGAAIQGNVLDTAYSSFIGLYPVASRYAMTPGELAMMVNDHFGVGAELHVVKMRGWRHDMWYDETGLPWVAPSPNIPDLESAAHYPGTVLFEGTNLSSGRGTPRAFAQIGAPWLDGQELAKRLNDRNLPGVRFEAVRFTPEKPADEKYDGVECSGVRFVVTDRKAYDPIVASVAALLEVHAMAPDKLTWIQQHFDRLAGTDRLRQMILAGAPLDKIVASWPEQQKAFAALRQRYLLYP